MERPDDKIPMDVWEAAEEPAAAAFDASVDLYETGIESASVRAIIARAIMAERSRCAKVARSFVKTHDTEHGIIIDSRADATAIAKAIRGEHQ